MNDRIKVGNRIYYYNPNTNQTTECIILDVDESNIFIELEKEVANKKQLKLPLSHFGEWLFYKKEDIILSDDELIDIFGYSIYGNQRFKKSLTASKQDLYVGKYIDFFYKRIVGFKKTVSLYKKFGDAENEYISIAMDRVSRLERKSGRLRNRVWSNCIFIFHDETLKPENVYKSIFKEKKEKYPFLFVRSYVYFVFINIQSEKQINIFNDTSIEPNTLNYKIWYFNSKYELKSETRKTNLFDITLNENETIDDYVYLANPNLEIERIKSVNSDVIDCIKAFTGELSILEETKKLIDGICQELETNKKAKILLEGPARSGKTIIAATLLHKYADSKMLLMNYYFYNALVDGLKSLSSFTPEEVEALVSSVDLKAYMELNTQEQVNKKLRRILENLSYALTTGCSLTTIEKTKKYLLENIEAFDAVKVDTTELPTFHALISSLLEFKRYLLRTKSSLTLFVDFGIPKILSIKNNIEKITSTLIETKEIKVYLELVCKAMRNLPNVATQRFFHHDISVEKGCWIKRGETTQSKVWNNVYRPQLMICDEFQRMGVIPRYNKANFDDFDEIANVINNCDQVFFTGDDYQKLNPKYDQGVERLREIIKAQGGSMKRFSIPGSVGVPREIGVLMKYLTHPNVVSTIELENAWSEKKYFEITFIYNNNDKFVELFDKDSSSKKHFAIPLDNSWADSSNIRIRTAHRRNPIVCFERAKQFPYFCNEEIMPKYFFSAYELISREVESIYVHIPDFNNISMKEYGWFCNHLYVLFTRATRKLVVNYESAESYEKMKRLVKTLKNNNLNNIISFI